MSPAVSTSFAWIPPVQLHRHYEAYSVKSPLVSFCSFSAKEKCFGFETGHLYFCFTEQETFRAICFTRVGRVVAGFTLARLEKIVLAMSVLRAIHLWLSSV